MTFPVSLIWALGGLLASGLAGFALKRGGYGLITDIGLGLGGSLIGSLIFRALGISLDAGLFPMVVVAFIGAAGVIVVQRMINDRLDTGLKYLTCRECSEGGRRSVIELEAVGCRHGSQPAEKPSESRSEVADPRSNSALPGLLHSPGPLRGARSNS